MKISKVYKLLAWQTRLGIRVFYVLRAPVHIRARVGDVAERVIVAGDPGRVDLVASMLSDPRLVSTSRGFNVYTGFYDGVRVSVAVHGVGGPSASIVFEELYMLRARVIIRLGTCGSLVGDVGIGDLVIPTGAGYHPGGLYYQYIGEHACAPAVPSYELLKLLVEEASSMGARYHLGPVISSDAFYAEDPQFASRWSGRGVIAVEMECATLFTLAGIRGFKAGALLVVSDSLVTWRHATSEELKETMVKAALIALNAIKRVTWSS
jgi:5'-methylthioadenosine phosphorylase